MTETRTRELRQTIERLLAQRREYAEARRRVQSGVAEDRDFYVSPFAANPQRTGPVGPGGSGFGVAPAAGNPRTRRDRAQPNQPLAQNFSAF